LIDVVVKVVQQLGKRYRPNLVGQMQSKPFGNMFAVVFLVGHFVFRFEISRCRDSTITGITVAMRPPTGSIIMATIWVNISPV
jgi:hypothetical protein